MPQLPYQPARQVGWLRQKLTAPLRRKLHRDFVQWRTGRSDQQAVSRGGLWRWLRRTDNIVARDNGGRPRDEPRAWLDFLLDSISRKLDSLNDLRTGHRAMLRTYNLAVSDPERSNIVWRYVEELRSGRRLSGAHRQDVSYYLRAAEQQFQRRVGQVEQEVEFSLCELGEAIRKQAAVVDAQDTATFWHRHRLAGFFLPVLGYQGDIRVRRAGFASLASALQSTPPAVNQSFVPVEIMNIVQETAAASGSDVWLRAEAAEVMARVDPAVASHFLRQTLLLAEAGDAIFLRRRLLRLAPTILPGNDLAHILAIAMNDPSAFVRQQVARVCWAQDDCVRSILPTMILEDSDPKVRAAAIASILPEQRVELSEQRVEPAMTGRQVDWTDAILELLDTLITVLDCEEDEFVIRSALHVASKLAAQRFPLSDPDAGARLLERLGDVVLPRVRHLQMGAKSTAIRRWASEAGESIWVYTDGAASDMRAQISRLSEIRSNESRFCAGLSDPKDRALLGRVLATMSQEDFGFDLRFTWRGCRVSRMPRFWCRAWRLLHELKQPRPDKRQAFRHSVGRHSDATLRVPSRLLAEMSPTVVPGEPRFLSDEQGWRPFVPLLDDFLSVLGISWARPQSVEFFTSEGITKVVAPRSLTARLIAWFTITIYFAKIARLRDGVDGPDSPAAYLQRLAELGFQIRFSTYESTGGQDVLDSDADATSGSCFPGLLVGGLTGSGLLEASQQFMRYFYSVYENSISHLLLFSLALLLIFLTRHAAANWRIRAARRRIALCMGGWGTRGKSGTERLKAALLSSLGFSVVSKSTGCEAMLLRSNTFGRTHEVPLYRPSGKATIWEHAQALRTAASSGADVFLWECMGLKPEYVDILQRQWTHDDLSTITNAYPDHEDLQGPAGWNVAESISQFVPSAAHLITTEKQMAPILAQACRNRNSTVQRVGWLESGLLTDDVLARFPYEEHPDNVALVAAVAEELQIDRDFALKEMADHVVADLGVLRTFPVARIGTRRLEFTNGMSANERLSCLANWSRCGFESHDSDVEPGQWLATLVNNRKDRSARTRVFADLLANDLSADCHYLVGSGVNDLVREVEHAWTVRCDAFSPFDHPEPLETWRAQLRWVRVVHTEAQFLGRMSAVIAGAVRQGMGPISNGPEMSADQVMSPGKLRGFLQEAMISGDEVASVLDHQARWLGSLEENRALEKRITTATNDDRRQVTSDCRRFLTRQFMAKLIIIGNQDVSSEQLVRSIVAHMPPGYIHRVMGLQNIKGPGIRLLESLQEWERVKSTCDALLAGRGSGDDAKSILSGDAARHVLCRDYVKEFAHRLPQQRNLIEGLDQRDWLPQGEHSASSLDTSIENAASGTIRGSLLTSCAKMMEDALDGLHSMYRRWKADRIYRDLEDDSISFADAIQELRSIDRSQEGGWLVGLLQNWSTDAPTSSADSWQGAFQFPQPPAILPARKGDRRLQRSDSRRVGR